MRTHMVEVTTGDVTRTFIVHYSSDLSGDVRFTEPAFQDTISSDGEATIPGEVLISLMGQIAGTALVSFAENFDFKALIRENL